MRVYHRYLGFFLAGIMGIYALSGTVLIFRKTDFLKKEYAVEKTISTGLSADGVKKELKLKNLEVERQEGDILYFGSGTYNIQTGLAEYKVKKLPFVLEKMNKLHKATSSQPLFFLNIFFAVGLLFFVVSAFWMFLPKTSVFRKGMYFALGGFVFALVLLFI